MQVQYIFEPRGRYSSIIQEGRTFLGPTDHTFFKSIGFRADPYMGHIHWKYPLLATLLDRWDAQTCTFHLPIGEMTITIEDIHKLYRLPVYGQRIQHVVDRARALLTISYLSRAAQVNTIIFKITFGGI